MTNCKKLLAIIVALVMLVSTLVSGLVVSAANPLGTLTVTGTTVDEGKDATVTFNLDLGENSVDALHMLVTIASDVAITDAEIGEVAYVSTEKFPAEDNELLDGTDPRLEISTKELAQGKLLFESGVATVAKVTDVEFTVTFATAELDAGDYDFNVTVDATDYDEADYDVITLESAITVCGAEEPKPDCDHADAELVYSVVDGNCITTKVCDCGYEEVIATVANTVADVKQGIQLAEGLAINFRTVASAVKDYKDIYGEFEKDIYTGNEVTGTQKVTKTAFAEIVSKVDYQTCKYDGVASYEMTSNIHLSLYGTDANGNVVLLRVVDYKFVDYLNSQYSKLTGIYRNVLGRLADYGTYIQLMNNYHTAHTPNDTMPADLKIDLPTTFNNTNVTETGIKINSTPKVGNTLTVNYRILKSDVANYDDFDLTIHYVDAYNASQELTVSLSDFTTYKSGGKEYWSYEFKGLVAAKINEINEVELKDAEGNEIGYLSSGLPSYLKKNYDSYKTSTDAYFSNFAKVCQAITAYGDAVAALYK